MTRLASTLSGVAAPASHWSGHDTQLIIAAALGIAVIIVLISKFSLHPFLALTIGSGVLGAVGGLSIDKMVTSFGDGLGSTVASVGTLIALGAMLGKLLADSGGADQIVDTIVRRSGPRMLPWAMALIAVLIGLPMFFEIGLVILVPVILLVAKRSGQPLLRLGIPALAGLSVLHGLVPPHPGPLVAISALHADLGITLGLGLIIAIPTVIIAGPLFGKLAARWVQAEPPEHLIPERAEGDEDARRPKFAITVATVLLPVVLMLAKAIADLTLPKSNGARTVLDGVGTPLVALLIAVVVAMFTLGRAAGLDRTRIAKSVTDSLPPIAGIMLIVGAGGGFKQVLVDAGLGKVITELASGATFSALLLGWVIAVALRLATGSATVATTAAAGIVAPLAAHLSSTHVALLALAVGAGSLFFSHVNDAGFWLVKEYFGMKVGQTIKSWSVMETITSVVGLGLVLVASVIV
ncbi:MAG TPA: gluconate:H+ symporter [Pseudonocardiaceae bacterium]|jgi:GntP family gluconate:H+ symporter|nr:gluconate:H+ symporter [Pseudonocardiaceae bacterium]